VIVYRVRNSWFDMKGDAEKYRVSLHLKPEETKKVEINDRRELAVYLNALLLPDYEAGAGAPAPEAPQPQPEPEATQELPDVDLSTFNQVETPDCVPEFLKKDPTNAELVPARTRERPF